MKIYLDTSCLNRIFDDQSQPRIYFESTAMLVIFQLIEKNTLDLISSDTLIFENSKNPFPDRKLFVEFILSKSKSYQKIGSKIVKRAKIIEKFGIKGIDALHLSCAEEQNANVFISCDDKVNKRYKGKLSVLNPIEFVLKILMEK